MLPKPVMRIELKPSLADLPEDSAVLIFASNKRYGGGYKNHSRAQEEWCFNNSSLPLLDPPARYYPVDISRTDGFNQEATSNTVDFTAIFMPAPYWPNYPFPIVLEKRVANIFELYKQSKRTTLVLGAWGTGVFQCPPELVYQTFKNYGQNTNILFRSISPRDIKEFTNVWYS